MSLLLKVFLKYFQFKAELLVLMSHIHFILKKKKKIHTPNLQLSPYNTLEKAFKMLSVVDFSFLWPQRYCSSEFMDSERFSCC